MGAWLQCNWDGFGLTVDPGGFASAAELEQLGFTTLWIVGGRLDRLDRLTELLDATERAVVGSAIIPPDVYDAATVSAFYHRAESSAPGRLLVGVGSPHSARPLAAVGRYPDQLDADEVPLERRMLAAFGPRALDVARDRFGGAMPGPAHARVRHAWLADEVGPDRILSVGLYAVLDHDAEAARATARGPLEFLRTLPAYVKSLRRQGFSESSVTGLSDSLVDALVAIGGPEDIAARAHQMRAAGADHVHLTVLHDAHQPAGLDAARLLAPALAVG